MTSEERATTVTPALTADRFGVAVTGRPDFEEWCDLFVEILDQKEMCFWGIGDLLIYAEETQAFGEDYAQVLDGARISERGLINRKSICRRFPRDKRLWNVSGGHYESVRALPDDRAFALLEEAERSSMTREDLREHVRALTNPTAPLTFDAELAWDAARSVFVPTVIPPTWITSGQIYKVKIKEAA